MYGLFERHHALLQPGPGWDRLVVAQGDDVRLHVSPLGRCDGVPCSVPDYGYRLVISVCGCDGVKHWSRVTVGDDRVAWIIWFEEERGHGCQMKNWCIEAYLRLHCPLGCMEGYVTFTTGSR